MTLEELQAQMAEIGFVYRPISTGDPVGMNGQFIRKVVVQRACLQNDTMYLVIDLYDTMRYAGRYPVEDPNRFTMEAEITGQFAAGLWTKLRVYGLNPTSFFKNEKTIEAALVKAWEAMS